MIQWRGNDYETGQLTNRFSGPKLAMLALAAERQR
jgi:hypothetical protein